MLASSLHSLYYLHLATHSSLNIFYQYEWDHWWIQTFGWGEPHRSRHSAREAKLIGFPVSLVYFFVGGWAKSIVKLDRGHVRIFPLDLPLNETVWFSEFCCCWTIFLDQPAI